MIKKLDQFIDFLRKDLGLFLSITFGIFLFVLFFEPFPLQKFDFNDRLIFIAGLAAIVWLFMVLVRIPLQLIMRLHEQEDREWILPAFLGDFITLALSSVAMAFYLRYVGSVSITFHIMFKVVLICLAVPVILRLSDLINGLKQKNFSLINEKKTIQKQIEKYEEDYLNKSIEFTSDNNTENLTLLIAEVACIKSADNYVEIVYREGDIFKKKLLRNTLKNIEHQIKAYTNFIRCHRICIVNTHFVEIIHRNGNNHWISLKGYDETIPVSRQYLLKLKETL